MKKRRKTVKTRRKAAKAKPARRKKSSARRPKPAARPRTLEEVTAANLADPYHAARIHRAFEMGTDSTIPPQTATTSGSAKSASIPIARAATFGKWNADLTRRCMIHLQERRTSRSWDDSTLPTV